jgi:hypothetical protein
MLWRPNRRRAIHRRTIDVGYRRQRSHRFRRRWRRRRWKRSWLRNDWGWEWVGKGIRSEQNSQVNMHVPQMPIIHTFKTSLSSVIQLRPYGCIILLGRHSVPFGVSAGLELPHSSLPNKTINSSQLLSTFLNASGASSPTGRSTTLVVR